MPLIRLAYSRVIDDLPFFVAIEEGFFEQEGVSVELVRLTGGANMIAAVLKDDLQAGIISASHVFCAAHEKLPIKVVAWLGKAHQGTRCGIHVRKESSIQSVGDLKGKRIALSGDISTRSMVFQSLAQSGMTSKDVDLILGIELGEPMKHEAVLKSGRVDAIVA